MGIRVGLAEGLHWLLLLLCLCWDGNYVGSSLPTGWGCLLGDPGCLVGPWGIAYGFENHPSGQIQYNAKGKMWGNIIMNSISLPLVAQSPLDRLGKAEPGLPALLSWWSWKKSPSLYTAKPKVPSGSRGFPACPACVQSVGLPALNLCSFPGFPLPLPVHFNHLPG